MDFLLLMKAAVIGLSIAAPVGPIGLLCMQRTLTSGAKVGFASGLGAASADAVYGAIGAFGLAAVTQAFTSLSTPLALFGGLFLIWLGQGLLRAKAPDSSASTSKKTAGIFRAFFSTLALTLASPMTILSFVAVFSALGGSISLTSSSAGTMVTGVFLGSATWWLMLAIGVAMVRHKISPEWMLKVSQIAGVLLIIFGGWQLLQLL
ncbi:lysine transporter LysE [Marinomonas sp. S3726]|uniref:LysE family translocator n=1 Tax=Marinomonas sp. S3726 TaxID=579484 RepID=UPI0005FA4F90|nr:LysE family transporter [Marinomonas sp. S3726]KJZ13292.1 lysine transporter LysE [Marinomonas sp. S3726]